MKHSTKLGTIALVCIAMAFFAACKKKDKKDDNIAKDKDGRVCGMSATMEARVCEDGSYAVFAKDGTCALICPEDNQNLGTDTAT
ncbi:MAG: hypothetical protein M9962_11495, partial [Oligoflexia bacterium]|nr:hypothetical protein [Oligoflexia bacterium]